jgi:hypothetical protein
MRLQKPNGISAMDLMSITNFGITLVGMKYQKANRILTQLRQIMQRCVITWLVWLDHHVAFHVALMRCIALFAYSSSVITIVNSKADAILLTHSF